MIYFGETSIVAESIVYFLSAECNILKISNKSIFDMQGLIFGRLIYLLVRVGY